MKKIFIYIGFVLLFAWNACEKEEYVNPYANLKDNDTTGNNNTEPLDPNSIAGIHENIFKKTCANSGCHDGTFEPDFRTVESSYNTLVNHPIIKNNPQGIYSLRVIPGNVQLSVLYKRLLEDIDGQSGIMPLALEPDSDWEEKKADYIGNIYNWIQNGAKDIFGNSPEEGIQPIQLAGLVATVSGTTSALPRSIENGAIQIPAQTQSIDLWFSVLKGNSSLQNMFTSEAFISSNINDFSNSTTQNLNFSNNQNWLGFSGSSVSFRFKITLDPSTLNPGLTYVRIKIAENEDATVLEMPNNGSAMHVKKYYALEYLP